MNLITNRIDCNIFKGIAIAGIFIHNYCHWLSYAPTENEYWWSYERFIYFCSTIFTDTFIINFFSFWGHYGVPIFVFVSGYGLVKKYEQNNVNISKTRFITSHLRKLSRMMIPGLILYYIVYYFLYHNLGGSVTNLFMQVLYLANFIPSKFLSIEPGPYWYFGLTAQLYIFFIVIVCKKNWNRLSVICILSIIFFYIGFNYPGYTKWLKYNLFGSILAFSFGIVFARCEFHLPITKVQLTTYTILTTFLIFLFEMNYFTWIFVPLLIIVSVYSIIELCPSSIKILFALLGKISHIIFVCHPTIRLCFYYKQEYIEKSPYIFLMLYIITTIMISIALYYIEKHLLLPCQNKS